MSESEKMGLFGSKDENNEEKTETNNTSDKLKGNPSERFAPYNIDSDSETYDTEALSIMDINDIIGVQADTPEDSTLESEFAALSEVITDSKDECVPQLQKPNDLKNNVESSDDPTCSKKIQDVTSKGESIIETGDPKQSENSANVSSMSKSLQLIGEAYISEDSQEADSADDAEEEPQKKCSIPSETPEVSINPTETLEPKNEVEGQESTDQVSDSSKAHFVDQKIEIEKKGEANSEKPSNESAEKELDSSTKAESLKSVDSIDAAVIIEPEIRNKVSDAEQMDVESPSPSEELKKPINEIPSPAELKVSKDGVENDIPDEKELPEAKKVEESRDTEEPMEVDEPTENLATSATDPTPKTIVENILEAVNCSENEKTRMTEKIHDIRPQINEKLGEDIVDVKFSSRLDPIKEESNVEDEKSSESAENKPEPTQEKVHKPEPEQSGKTAEIVPEESSEEIVQEKTPKDQETEVVPEEQNTKIEQGLENMKKIEVSAGILPEERKEVTEPMEIDDPEQEEIKVPVETCPREECPEKVETISILSTENQSNNDNVEKRLETTTASQKIVEPVKKDEFLDNRADKSPNDSETIKENSKLSGKSLDIDDVVPVQSSDDLASGKSFDRVTEDEKMEVDGLLKTTSNKEEPEVSERRDSSETTEKSVKTIEMSAETIENKCGIDTVDDAEIASLGRKKIIDVAVASSVCNKNTPEEKIDEQNDANEESLTAIDQNEESIEQVDEKEENRHRVDEIEAKQTQINEIEENKNETEENEGPGNKINENDHRSHRMDESTEDEEVLHKTQVPECSPDDSRSNETEIMGGETNNTLNEDLESVVQKKVTNVKYEQKVIEDTSIVVEKMEISTKKTEKVEDDLEKMGEKKILDTSENLENTDQEAEGSQEPKSIEESVSNVHEKKNISKTELSIEDEKESSLGPETVEINSENSDNKDELEDSISSEKLEDETHMEILPEEEKATPVRLEPIEMNAEKIENRDELKNSVVPQKSEDQMDTEIPTEEKKANLIVSEKTEHPPRDSHDTDSQKDESVDPREDAIPKSPDAEENEDANVTKTEEESENSEIPRSHTNPDDEVNSDNVRSSNESENKDSTSSTNVETSSKISEANDGESREELTEAKPEIEKMEESNETGTKSEILCEEKENETKTSTEGEVKEFPRSKLPSEVSNTSENSGDFEMKEVAIEDGMTLSADDPDVFATGENPLEDDSRTRESPDRMFTEQEMETEGKTETNISEDTEEKNEEQNVVQVDNRLEQSDENSEETQEKSLDGSLKTVLASGSVCVRQIFNDDEQSQSTQEMMESISETDKGNINKILDEQEASDLETAAMNNDDEQSQSTQEMMESILETDKGNINKILDEQEASDLETAAMNNVEKLPEESEDMLNKALADPMGTQNIDSLEGLLDLDFVPENDESTLKSVEPIVDKVMQDSCDDIETIGKSVDVGLLMEENETIENSVQNEDYESAVATEVLDNDPEAIASPVDHLMGKSDIQDNQELQENSDLTDKDLEAFDLASVVSNPLHNVDPTEDTKINLAEDLLREIAVDEEQKITLTQDLLLDDDTQEQDLLLSASIETPTKMDMPDEVFLPVEAEPDMELAEDISLDAAVRDQVLSDVAAEIESLPATSEISELESAVKFLQESEEQDIESSLALSPKLVEDVVDEMVESSDVGIFANEADICEDPSELVAELEGIIPDPIAISEAEIINEAAKLEIERKTQMSEKVKSLSPICPKVEEIEEEILRNKIQDTPRIIEEQKIPEVTPEFRETKKIPEIEKMEHEPLKKSAPIPKISILEERLKIPPKIEIPVGEVTRMCGSPSTTRTSLLIQRDARASNLMKQLESPKSSEKSELKIVDTPRKEGEKHDFENVGSPRIILKIAKSAIADCSEPRSPKSPKIRSATNSPNPEDSPGQKLGKIKLKLSKGGHPSIISNDNIEDHVGQWHTEGSSSLSPLGMKIKFSKIPDSPSHQTDRHEVDETREQTSKHKFEEAKRTDSPLGMKIKLSKTGEPTIVQQEIKETTTKHKDKFDSQQDSPKRSESSIGMKIKLSKSGDASIIQPDKQETMEEHKDGSSRVKDKLEMSQHSERTDIPRRTESPLGMKFKLFKTGDASIVQAESPEENQQDIKRTSSPVGKKSKQPKSRTTMVSSEFNDEMKEKLEIEAPRRTESPLGMKIKLSKRGDASIILNEETREAFKQRPDVSQDTTSEGSSTSKSKTGKTILQPEVSPEGESVTETPKRVDPSIGMKIKLSKSGDASIVHTEREENLEEIREKEKSEILQENSLKIDSSIGMKIKLSKTGDASIIASASTKKSEDPTEESENPRMTEAAVKTKLSKACESSIVETDKKDKSSRRKETEMPLEMKIKLSKTGHPTIVACDNYIDSPQRGKDSNVENPAQSGSSKQSSSPQENSGMKILKSMQGGNLHGVRSELTIEPVQLQVRKSEITDDSVSKRKDITISPIESKKAKLEAKLSQMLPEVTIQPVAPREQKQQMMFDTKSGSISRQQMNVISQEISITQVRSHKPMDLSMTDKLKSILTQNAPTPSSDCEIIEHRPELIIVNENSNSSQDVMIIEEVPVIRPPEHKVPKKRGRPRRNPLPIILAKPTPLIPGSGIEPMAQRDPLALDDVTHMASHVDQQMFPPIENEAHGRPKRTCRSQKSYAPPRRGRGRGGRGKRKMDMNLDLTKRPRIEQDLDMIERSTTALITIHDPPSDLTQNTLDSSSEAARNTSELYKALRQPTMDRKMPNALARNEVELAVNESCNNPDFMTKNHLGSLMDARIMSHLDGVINTSINKTTSEETFEKDRKMLLVDISTSEKQTASNLISGELQKSELPTIDNKIMETIVDDAKNNKNTSGTIDHENWLTPSSRKLCDAGRSEGNISNVQVMDEETRMSAESGSRSQTPAKNMSLQAPETIVNEESQGSVLSTATTESEKVKVKVRRMEITLDPDEGPFTVEKVAEYDWPLDPTKKNETFMIQEQISHYLGVKSFKRKYPDLKRRMVDMEERNFLRENGLVSEAMCDMGLTAVLSAEVLDIMCSDFPDQYEEYRKHIREKQMKEHLKKQKELTAAANAEKNRIDLAEMAVQSALSWNIGLNKARRESRKCSLDLQTFTIHVPKKQQKVEEESGSNHYPVALIPGQYTDYYREYTPAELRYYPLNTVLYGPMRPNERKFDSQSEGSQSDSDSDSSSDDSSSTSSEGTQDTEASQSTMDDVDAELSRQKEDIKTIKCKMCLKHLNKFSRPEVLIQCGTCNGFVHPSCIDLTLDMVPHIQAYAWQCTDCKTCAQCHDPADEDKMLFCDMCDRGYHIYCVGLRRVPQGRWHCQECAVCASCGSREAGGTNSDRNSVAQWQHEYKKGDKNTRVYVSTLCVPCSKLWRKGRYCPHCSRCHTVQRLDLEVNLVHCSACDKYLHLGCVESKDLTVDRKNYRCDFCQPLRHHMVKPLVSKVFRT